MPEAAFLQFARTYAPYKPGVRDIQIFNTQSDPTRCQFRSFPLALSNSPLCIHHQADFLYELERETEVIILF